MHYYLRLRGFLSVLFFMVGFTLFGQVANEQLPALTSIHHWKDKAKPLGDALPKSGRILFVFYDPGCGSCQELGAGIAKSDSKIKNTQVFFISMHDNDLVDGYINMYAKNLKNMKNVSFWKDPGAEFIEKMKPINYPATYLFDAKTKKLIKSFQGESKIERMSPILN